MKGSVFEVESATLFGRSGSLVYAVARSLGPAVLPFRAAWQVEPLHHLGVVTGVERLPENISCEEFAPGEVVGLVFPRFSPDHFPLGTLIHAQ